MRRLRDQQPGVMGDEEHHNLFDGLQDIRYARDFLHVTGPPGSAEHARFDETSWGYGDPTYMGGDLLEVFDSQLKSVVHTLFGAHGQNEAGNEVATLGADFHHAAVSCGEDEFLGDLVSLDGGPLLAETIAAIPPRSIAEHLEQSRNGRTQRRHHYPGKGVASIGTGKMNSLGYRVSREPCGGFEDIIGVEISGRREAVESLTRYLRAGCGEGVPAALYQWKPGTAAGRMLGEADPARSAVILLIGFEYFDLRSLMHDVVFARLLAAWDVMQREKKREMKREIKHGTDPEPVAHTADTGEGKP